MKVVAQRRETQECLEAAGQTPKQGRPKAVYSIIESKGETKSFWLRLGTAYVNRDESLTVVLNALPVNNRLHIRELPNKHRS